VNKDISYTLDYHESTKHSEISIMTSRHSLDWDNRPIPFKIYTELPSIPLPSEFPLPALDAISAISNIHPKRPNSEDTSFITTKNNTNSEGINTSKNLSLKELCAILFFSAGITREMKYDYGTFYMRAASATGALYPIELYVICKYISPNLKAGVYHFSPADFSLTQIRAGDYRTALAAIAGDHNQDILTSPLTIIFTSYAWRNAWKYQARSYRHWFWDSGVIAANLLATTISMDLDARIIMGFIDDEVNHLLALEKQKEASIAMVAIGIGSDKDLTYEEIDSKEHTITDLPATAIKSRPLSGKEVQYPEIWKLLQHSKLFSKEEVKQWTKAGLEQAFDSASFREEKDLTVLTNEQILNRQPLSREYESSSNISSIGEVILKRGSTRTFTRTTIPFSTLSSILYNSTRGIPIDFKKKDADILTDIYFIANSVEGISSGAYFFNRNQNSLEFLKDKVPREMSGYLCLGQSLFSDASTVLFLMSSLKKVLDTLGNRGYRAAQFEAGIIAGKVYLSAYAQGIGASGSTFFDDAVTEFFSPHAKNKSTMIAIGLGVPAYKAHSGKVLPVRLTREQLLKEDIENFS
jgi:SagB-type dehydrogenase family enzyme